MSNVDAANAAFQVVRHWKNSDEFLSGVKMTEANTMPAWGVPGQTPEEGEWPARDAVPRYMFGFDPASGVDQSAMCVAEVQADGSLKLISMEVGVREPEVTNGMVSRGFQAAVEIQPNYLPMTTTLEAIYRAMAAVSRVPLVSDGELAAVRERDEAKDGWMREYARGITMFRQIASLRAELMAARAENVALGELYVNANARWIEAHDKLAKLTVVPDPPKPAHDFTRDFSGDRRRVGG